MTVIKIETYEYVHCLTFAVCVKTHITASMRGIEIQKAIQGKTAFIKPFFNGWSNRNDSFGRPSWKLDADEMLKKSAL